MVQNRCWTQWKRSCLVSNANEVYPLRCCKWLLTFCATTCCLENNPISWLRTLYVTVRFIKAMQTRCLLSLLLKTTSCWDPSWCFVWPSLSYRNHILPTIMNLDWSEQRYCERMNHNSVKIQFDFYQSQKRDNKRFFFLHKLSQQLSTKQQLLYIISAWEICWTTSVFQHMVDVITSVCFS